MIQVSHYKLPDGNVQIAFSGGRTSAYMLHQIAEANGGIPDRVRVVFTNTGREMPETLDFVQEVGDRWAIKIDWVEYETNAPAGERFRTVSHNSAARNGEPFRDLIVRKKYLPNQQARFCTSDLKVRPAKQFLVSIGWNHWSSALGIRADEPTRVNREPPKEKWVNWYPLADAGATKAIVTEFWAKQPFDLRLQNVKGKTPMGNCDGCFLKSEAFLAGLARDHPEKHQWWQDMEDLSAEWTLGSGAKFSKRYSRRELGWSANHQAELFDVDDGFCQADGGECID